MKFLSIFKDRPRTVLLFLLIIIGVVAIGITKFQVDASAETLMNQHDPDYVFSKKVELRYQSDDSIVVVYRPTKPLFTAPELDKLRQLRADLLGVKGVLSVISILDLPIVNYPNSSFGETLNSPNVNLPIAEMLFKNSPLYKDMVLSYDGQTTGMQLVLDPNKMKTTEDRHKFLNELRVVIEPYNSHGQVYLGGLDVIADDMISFLQKDLIVFGILVLLSMTIVLTLLFRRAVWILVALSCCAASAIMMMGVLGYLGLKVTVLSSNFISLQTILTLSLITHIIVKFQEVNEEYPDQPHHWMVAQTVKHTVTPSFFTSLANIVGFAALLQSSLVPVISFGWMMIAGLAVSFVMTFFLFVTIMLCLPKRFFKASTSTQFPVTQIGLTVERHRYVVLAFSGLFLVLGLLGMSKLQVENSFVNYFKEKTDLHQSLVFIDKNLGGTTPLTLLIEMPSEKVKPEEGFEGFEEFEGADSKIWLTRDKVDKLAAIHHYLDSRPEVGKVLSLWTTVQISEQIYQKPLGNFELAVLRNFLPESLRHMLWDSFVSLPQEEFRITLRMRDSDPNLKRNVFLQEVKSDIVHKFDLPEENVHLTGAAVLYNNVLQELFDSQIRTMGISIGIIFVVLMILMRNIRLAMVALFPNVIAAIMVLGLMGWAGIPLDLMTITIASITMGIAMDDAIHYIYRFRKEFYRYQDYNKALRRTHRAVGQAMIYTALTVSLGFLVLCFSSFIPNILFGLFTALAMIFALMGSLALMPVCLVMFKPFGKPEA